MPYLQRATANYFGFQPAKEVLSINNYLVSSSATTGATAIYPGDVVVFSTLSDGDQVVRVITGAPSSTDAGVFAGVAASYVPALGGSTGADPRIHSSQTCLVYDHPDQVFYGCDTTSGVIGVSPLGKSYGVTATGVIGSTGPNGTLLRSVMAISGVTASSGSANGYAFKVIGLHPIENAYSSIAAGTAAAATAVRKFLLVPALPLHGRRDRGVVTT